MTDERMRIKIAEALGYKWTKPYYGTLTDGTGWVIALTDLPHDRYSNRGWGKPPPANKCHKVLLCSDYPDSLDACSAFEEKMWNTPNDRPKKQKWGRYRNELKRICLRDGQRPAICANAHQRCEAFLRVKGLWKE